MTTPPAPEPNEIAKSHKPVFAHDVISNCTIDDEQRIAFKNDANRQELRDPETGIVIVVYTKANGHILVDEMRLPDSPTPPTVIPDPPIPSDPAALAAREICAINRGWLDDAAIMTENAVNLVITRYYAPLLAAKEAEIEGLNQAYRDLEFTAKQLVQENQTIRVRSR